MKNYHLDLVRVTEAGAISAAEWVGRGDKEQADKVATESMRNRLNQIDFSAEIAIGEGKKDGSYGLYDGEPVGSESGPPEYSIAIDPIEGTTPTAKGGYEAMSVIALAGKDCLYKTEAYYMAKLAVGPRVAKLSEKTGMDRLRVGLENTVKINIGLISWALDKPIERVTVCVLDRPRNEPLVEHLRSLGCRIKFISDCDVTACIAVCMPDSGIDAYMGIGGAPEAVIAAAAMKSMGGNIECCEWDKSTETLGPVLTMEKLAKGPTMFAATGITDGQLLSGVRFSRHGIITNSIAMRSESGTIRRFETQHGN
jgi:fructose-1,6-bisphosphatase II